MLKGRFTGLRAIERNDLSQLLEWRNRPEYRRYFREFRELGADHQSLWYEKTVLSDSRVRMFAVIELSTARLLGASGLCYIDWPNRSADFSIYLGVDDLYIEDKFAPDAAKTMARYAFEELNLHRLWAEVYDIDQKKKRLFETLGFSLDGRLRQSRWSESCWHDSLFFSLLSPEYERLRAQWFGADGGHCGASSV